ncbi:PREDICTED: CAP-Gly domain-containing linker protein 1-like isoform X2 [Amphimedon queenslandica]|uniref:CAP-Gly domain-containing protein n=1 Tax=Amphimedon queenslandica TaxID=400682 RepID=A0AAN0IFT0_AMPQE|nr:PREDICTED: CAP-Gly domain-containing linker protein 1-like isoform X2 [Amphimedon queenslandica]|eukprot:XP_003387401.1 PREDICTED: CAP-Gly domain-containing linker protein 1-like isoform X2 [Amphimedon queenslandica]
MSRLRAPGAVGPRAIRPPSGLIRPPMTAGVGPGPTKSHVAPQARPPAQTPPNRTTPTQANSFPYQVGDSVLVGGEKPGKVAFIGPTQFAQGVWAGIILDTPDGKNDGSVKGVAYFKCPPNYGLFAKLDKLSPLPQQQKPHPSQSSESGEPEFSLGDRVIADGGKKGTVSFVGPTQFAKGTWIGVSLDAPEGKNDGKVGGVQYFTCPPNHGLFTRPIKLTLDTAATPTNQSTRSSGGVTPADPSELKKKAETLRIGDRVLVNNSKEGTLRFLGPTHFAKGIWVGVELDDAQGKNDGAVSGKRYFQCEAAHGLFAPLPKVERIGPTADLSRRSIRGLSGSPGSSVSSLSSKGILRQLQQQQNLPLEPEPISPARSDTSGNDFSHIMFEKNHQIATLKSSLEQSEQDKVKLSEETTELRRKVEDLQFLLEEQDIISGDKLEEVSTRESTELQQLKTQLEEEKEKRKKAEEELKSSLSELETLKSTTTGAPSVDNTIIEEKNKEIERLEREKEQLQTEVNAAKLALTSAEGDFKSTETAAKDLQSELDTVKLQLQETLELCAQQETLLEEKLSEMETLDEEKKQTLRDLERVTGEKQSLLSSTEQLINERDSAMSQCNRLMAESSSVTSEQGYLAQQNSDLLTERDQLKQELREMKSLLEKANQEKEDALHSVADLKNQDRAAQGQSHEIQIKYESLQKELYSNTDELDRTRRESAALNEEIEQLKLTNQQKVEMSEAVISDLKARLSSMTQERDVALQEAQGVLEDLEKVKKKRNELIENSKEYQKAINELQDQLEDVTQHYNSLVTEQQSGSIQGQLEETEERLEQKMRELEESKERVSSLEEEIVILSSNSTDDPRLAVLEKEKLRLEELVNQLNTKGTGGEQDSQIILELKEDNRTLQASLQDKDQEITFLNSVIAELQLKVESLESLNGLGDQATMLGYTSEDDMLGSQLPPPRVFCDICDEFDLHDTADCPLQAADQSPPHSMHHGIRAQERPYCENCEVFGHWTDECEYEETY